jgi:hypothetical protein
MGEHCKTALLLLLMLLAADAAAAAAAAAAATAAPSCLCQTAPFLQQLHLLLLRLAAVVLCS